MGMHICFEEQLPSDAEVVFNNDEYFDRHTFYLLDARAEAVIRDIDNAHFVVPYTRIQSDKFDVGAVDVDELSSGCKTCLNILYNPSVYFDFGECGSNAMWYAITKLEGRGIYHGRTVPDNVNDPISVSYQGSCYTSIYDLGVAMKEDR